jgi:hypothetical protein
MVYLRLVKVADHHFSFRTRTRVVGGPVAQLAAQANPSHLVPKVGFGTSNVLRAVGAPKEIAT